MLEPLVIATAMCTATILDAQGLVHAVEIFRWPMQLSLYCQAYAHTWLRYVRSQPGTWGRLNRSTPLQP